MIAKIIKLWSENKPIITIWTAISSLLAVCWSLDETNLLLQAIGQLVTPILVKIILTLFLLGIGLIASIIVLYLKLRAKPKIKDYDYIEDPGIYIHKKSKNRYCGKCFDRDKLYRLSFDNSKGLICRQCGEPFVTPYDYESAWKQANIKENS